MFSKASSSSISFAIVTPSFVMSGAPYDLSSTTFLPFGPSVTLTVFANLSTPAPSAALASEPYLISFAISLHLLFILFDLSSISASLICSCSSDLPAILLRISPALNVLYSTIARISFCLTMIYSSPSSSTSVPAYLE